MQCLKMAHKNVQARIAFFFSVGSDSVTLSVDDQDIQGDIREDFLSNPVVWSYTLLIWDLEKNTRTYFNLQEDYFFN